MRAHTYVKVTTQYGHDVIEARHDDGQICTVWLPVEYDDHDPTSMGFNDDDVPVHVIEATTYGYNDSQTTIIGAMLN